MYIYTTKKIIQNNYIIKMRGGGEWSKLNEIDTKKRDEGTENEDLLVLVLPILPHEETTRKRQLSIIAKALIAKASVRRKKAIL